MDGLKKDSEQLISKTAKDVENLCSETGKEIEKKAEKKKKEITQIGDKKIETVQGELKKLTNDSIELGVKTVKDLEKETEKSIEKAAADAKAYAIKKSNDI